MPFNDPILGGDDLVRPQMQSPNFVSGSAGWIIRKDGSVEFNNGVFRGSIQTGASPGQRIVINNPITGDAVDIYDNANNLVYSITNAGAATSFSPANGHSVEVINGNIVFNSTVNPPTTVPSIESGYSPSFTEVFMDSGTPTGTVNGNSSITAIGSTTVSGAILQGKQRGVTGNMLQTDGNIISLMHMGNYSGTTNGTGHLVFNHGASFTPTGGVVTGTAPGGTFANLTFGINNFTSTQADVNWTVANTGAAFATSFITFNMLMWG